MYKYHLFHEKSFRNLRSWRKRFRVRFTYSCLSFSAILSLMQIDKQVKNNFKAIPRLRNIQLEWVNCWCHWNSWIQHLVELTIRNRIAPSINFIAFDLHFCGAHICILHIFLRFSLFFPSTLLFCIFSLISYLKLY